MRLRGGVRWVLLAAVLAVAGAACSSDDTGDASGSGSITADESSEEIAAEVMPAAR